MKMNSFSRIAVLAGVVVAASFISGCAGTKAGAVLEDYNRWVEKKRAEQRQAEERHRAARQESGEYDSRSRPTAQDCAYGSTFEQLRCSSYRSRGR